MTVEPQTQINDELTDARELQRKLQILRSGFEAQRYPDAATRIDRLDRLWSALDRFSDRLCEALSDDFGYRSPRQSYFADVATTGKAIRLTKKGVRKWMKAERRKADFPFGALGAKARVHYQPLGVVGVISPWNIPVNLTLTPLAGALGAGNRALIKPSEHTPSTSEVMVELIASAFAEDEVTTVTGDARLGQMFSELPLDHLVFTGGTSIARHIMRAAAENLTPLTLELGGKSPVMVGANADLEAAAKRIVFGKVFNAGQVCLAPDYVLVPAAKRDELVHLIQEEIKRSLPGGAQSPDYVAVINPRQSQRIQGYIDEAREAGAPVFAEAADNAAVDRRIPITLIVDPDESLRVSQEEIFGPILVIRSYETFDEAVNYVNARPRPLALYYFGDSADEQRQVIENTTSGGVTINDVIMHYTFDDLPFGGVGPSGMGVYHGFDGFRQFSNARAVYHQTRVDLGRIIRPPYGRLFDRFSAHLMTRG
ncbi:coniferyl aldehyde dehydrogenase [uncultured Abyssibacter sp.]|uniref:coniferyl aldehyde dehydrogenase n=1 Tax=uncultured Abyssibacter sp. TaxID=2320202 RepID=UPI0032B29619